MWESTTHIPFAHGSEILRSISTLKEEAGQKGGMYLINHYSYKS